MKEMFMKNILSNAQDVIMITELMKGKKIMESNKLSSYSESCPIDVMNQSNRNYLSKTLTPYKIFSCLICLI